MEQINKSNGKELKQNVKIIESKERDLERINQEKDNLKANREKAIREQQQLINERKNDAIASKFQCQLCEKIFNVHQDAKDTQTLKPTLKEIFIQTESYLKTVDNETKRVDKADLAPSEV